MIPARVLVSKPAKRAIAVVRVDDVVPDPQVGEGRRPAARRRRGGRATAMDETAKRDHREAQLGRDEAVAERRLGEQQRRIVRRDLAEEPGLDPVEGVAGALGLAAALEGDHHPVSRAQLRCEQCLRLGDRAGGRGRGLGAERARRSVVGGSARADQAPAPRAAPRRRRRGGGHRRRASPWSRPPSGRRAPPGSPRRPRARPRSARRSARAGRGTSPSAAARRRPAARRPRQTRPARGGRARARPPGRARSARPRRASAG